MVELRQALSVRLVRLTSRLAAWALGLLVLVFGIAGWQGWAVSTFVVCVGFALRAGISVAVAPLITRRGQ